MKWFIGWLLTIVLCIAAGQMMARKAVDDTMSRIRARAIVAGAAYERDGSVVYVYPIVEQIVEGEGE